MPVRIEPHAEPIPGYRLIERLGGGGFGEVWKATAPGGLFKAIKFVYGEVTPEPGAPPRPREEGRSDSAIDDSESDNTRADQEFKALRRLKTVHHPYILSLERYDIISGQLIIVMELADKTLWDRFKECRDQGLPGIPRDELLNYMRETAEALDLMNNQFQLQHLDIKPQNLFLVFNHVKVADFGLVKDLGSRAQATITGGVTPVYAAPETFDGWLSRFSDQYSLAIVYQELLTGQRPFDGKTMRQLVLQHIQGIPDLTPLPAAERAIVARALAKDPEQRYPTCLEFIHLLRSAVAKPLAPAEAPADTDTEATDADDTPHTQGVRGRADVLPRRRTESESGYHDRPQVLPPRPDRGATPAEANQDDDSHGGHTVRANRLRTGGTSNPDLNVGAVQPSLVFGLGKLGLKVLRELRRRLTAEIGPPEALPHIRLLGIDTDAEAVQASATGEPSYVLQPTEVVQTALHRPSHYLKSRDGKQATEAWLNPRLIYRIPRDQNSAGLRPLGRLAFMDNFRLIAKRLEAELTACCAEGPGSPEEERLGLRSARPRVYVVANVAGNTGGGMFLDAAFVARSYLRQIGHAGAEVVGVFLMPPAIADGPRRSGVANAHAAMLELNHYSRHAFSARYDAGEGKAGVRVVNESVSPFHRCIVLTLPDATGPAVEPANERAATSAAEYLYRDLATQLGTAADEGRRHKVVGGEFVPLLQGGPTFQSVGLYQLTWPRRALIERCARRLCRRLVDRWMSKDARPLVEPVQRWAAERWDGLALRPENLIGRLQELAVKTLGQPPDRILVDAVAPLADALVPREGSSPNLAPVVAGLSDLDKVLGVPEDCRLANQPPSETGTLETGLVGAAALLADSCEHRLAEQVVRLIEDPDFRLAGAEEALRQLSDLVEKALRSQETLAAELTMKAAQLYLQVHMAVERPVSVPATAHTTVGPAWKLGFSRRGGPGEGLSPGAELLDQIRSYAKARYHSLVLAQTNRLYVSLRGLLSDQLREVGFCRQRLGELAGLVLPPGGLPVNPPSPQTRLLLPTGCRTLEEALEKAEQELTTDDLGVFDRRVQTVIEQHFRALVQVCMGTSVSVRGLAPMMIREGERFLGPRFQGTSVADLFLAPKGGEEGDPTQEALAELQEFLDEARPSVGASDLSREVVVAMVPDDGWGKELQGLIRNNMPEVTVVPSDRLDEVVFYREQPQLGPTDVPALSPVAQEAYRQRLAADPVGVHTRADVAEWQRLVPARTG